MSLSFHPDARRELLSAMEWYDDNAGGRGWDLLAEVEAAILNILEYPELWPATHAFCQRCLTGRYPYAIVYQIHDAHIIVFAVAHASRRPGYWKSRKS